MQSLAKALYEGNTEFPETFSSSCGEAPTDKLRGLRNQNWACNPTYNPVTGLIEVTPCICMRINTMISGSFPLILGNPKP